MAESPVNNFFREEAVKKLPDLLAWSVGANVLLLLLTFSEACSGCNRKPSLSSGAGHGHFISWSQGRFSGILTCKPSAEGGTMPSSSVECWGGPGMNSVVGTPASLEDLGVGMKKFAPPEILAGGDIDLMDGKTEAFVTSIAPPVEELFTDKLLWRTYLFVRGFLHNAVYNMISITVGLIRIYIIITTATIGFGETRG
jgi:hypothetical protein